MILYQYVVKKNEIWEKLKIFEQKWTVEWLLLPNKAEFNKLAWEKGSGVVYDMFEYKFRCEFWPEIKKWDKFQDEFWKNFEIKRVVRNPWFNGDDHLLLYLNECDDI